MSYILEALKKAEQKRRKGSVPGLQSVHDAGSVRKRKRSLWPWLLVAVVIINVVLILRFRPKDIFLTEENQSTMQLNKQSQIEEKSDSEATPVNTVPGATEPITEVVDPAVKMPAAGISDSVEIQMIVEDIVNQQEEIDNSTVTEPTSIEPTAEPITTEQEPLPVDEIAIDLQVEEIEPVQDDEFLDVYDIPPANDAVQVQPAGKPATIPLLENLPGTLRQDIPELAISFHVYTQKPKGRLVSINGRLLREGQSVAEDLTLEEITAKGVVFNYKGDRFRIAVF